MRDLLVVAGEASGDLAAAAAVSHLGGRRAFGMGGAALEASGVELLCDLRETTALGLAEPAARAWSIGAAFRRLGAAASARRPRAALLVNYTEFNTRLAARLRAEGVRVLWYIAPQVWAWRAGRGPALRRSVDRMAVILPFEEATWRAWGIDAHYVGHPACEAPRLDRAAARQALALTPLATAVALLPGSRPHEVDRLLPAMLEAYELVRRERASVDARVLLAASLDPASRARAAARCEAARVATFDVDPLTGATGVLAAFDAALCASGTASLEAALARAVPVVTYRVATPTEIAARLLVRARHFALPNVLLGRPAFEELLQRGATPAHMAGALEHALDERPALLGECDRVEAMLGAARSPSRAVARMLAPWLGLPRTSAPEARDAAWCAGA
jgi:lipid-A-disaccharide synthase